MKNLLKVAVLEDSEILLNDIQSIIEENEICEVQIASTTSKDFIEQMKTKTIDALILDITLEGDSMNGVEIANRFNLPVFFITGNADRFVNEMVDLSARKDAFPVHFMTKPLSTEKFISLFTKFEKTINALKKTDLLPIKFVDYYQLEPLKQDDIVYIRSDYKSNANNKKIQLITRNEECTVSRKSMDYFFEQGLSKENFIQTSQSFIVNKRYLTDNITRETEKTSINFIAEGKPKTVNIEITEEYWKNRKKQ